MLIDNKKLELYVKNNLNVLFEGERGVGKTATIYKVFNEQNLRVKYFSAPTMDPWTDLVGIPSSIKREDGKEVLRMIQPEDFVDNKYDVIFIDELNRAQPKVLNALMELIQFGSINGKKYNIKMIWAAINPHTEDGEYDVERLDPAIKDRFQIHIKFPYKVDVNYFEQEFGKVGVIFAEWWDSQPTQIQKEISPRRLYEAAKFYNNGGDLEDILVVGNLVKLQEAINNENELVLLDMDYEDKNIKLSKKTFIKPFSKSVSNYFRKNEDKFNFFFDNIPDEWLSNEFTSSRKEVYSYIVKKANEGSEKAKTLINSIICKNKNSDFFITNKKELEVFASESMLSELKELSDNMFKYNLGQTEFSKSEKTVIEKMFGDFKINSVVATVLISQFVKFKINYGLEYIETKKQNVAEFNALINIVAFKTAAMLSLFEENVSVSASYKKTKGYDNLVELLYSKEKNGMFTNKKGDNYISDLIEEHKKNFENKNAKEICELYNKTIRFKNSTSKASEKIRDPIAKSRLDSNYYDSWAVYEEDEYMISKIKKSI